MKIKMKTILICLLLLPLNSIFGQSIGTLHLSENKLIGKCENKLYSGFEIELDTVYSKMDSTLLFSQLPRIGKLNFRNRFDTPTEFTLTERAGYAQIMFRFRNNYHTFDNLKINDQYLSFTINSDPDVPATENDLKIIRIAKQLLGEEKYWNKNDDRTCDDDLMNKSYSLYCALRISSLEIEEKYNHRNAVLQKLRHLIAQKYPTRKWNHRLMDFNNMEETAYEDIVDILNQIEQAFIMELNDKK